MWIKVVKYGAGKDSSTLDGSVSATGPRQHKEHFRRWCGQASRDVDPSLDEFIVRH